VGEYIQRFPIYSPTERKSCKSALLACTAMELDVVRGSDDMILSELLLALVGDGI
jgi:hypothetical protein